MIDLPQFAEFRKLLRYKPRIKGMMVAEKGRNPQTVSQGELDEMFHLPNDKEIEIRLDPLEGAHSLHTTLICEERAKRPTAIKRPASLLTEELSCDFCRPRIHLETAVPKMYHSLQPLQQPVITANNLFPYILPHFVTILTQEHKLRAEDLTEEDIATFLCTGKEIAYKLREEGLDGMWDLINWGASAGGSQPHPHAQRGGLDKMVKSLMDKESEILNYRKKELGGKDPFDWYLDLVGDSLLLIHENEAVSVFAPYAPRFTDQVDIVTKRNKGVVSNYLKLTPRDIDLISTAIIMIINGLTIKRGMTEFNLVTHQARFDDSNGYRLHWHLYPRKGLTGENSIGGMELNDVYVVSAYPEDTARALTTG